MSRSAHDFDFIYGEWTILHRKLKERMAGSDEWLEFETNYEAWPILNGLANADKAFGVVGGDYFEGMSIRTYDVEKDLWTIYWMDTSHPLLQEQVRGRFENGVGIFFGEEMLNGKTYRLRFLWKKNADDSLRWDQAFQDPETKEWETNWIMEFTRKTAD